MTKYILLPDHTVREEPDLLTWARALEQTDRVVRQEQVGPWRVSTVFLGLDHNWARFRNPELPPLLFETMAFEDKVERPVTFGERTMMVHDSLPIQERCSTWDEAVAQHERIVDQLRKALVG